MAFVAFAITDEMGDCPSVEIPRRMVGARPGDVIGTFCATNVFPFDLWRNGEMSDPRYTDPLKEQNRPGRATPAHAR